MMFFTGEGVQNCISYAKIYIEAAISLKALTEEQACTPLFQKWLYHRSYMVEYFWLIAALEANPAFKYPLKTLENQIISRGIDREH